MAQEENRLSDIRGQEDFSKRDLLYNEVLETIKEYGQGMEIGLVSAVLAEVDSEIRLRTGRQDFATISNRLKKKKSSKCNRHSLTLDQ